MDVELGVDVLDVATHGVFGDEERLGDAGLAVAAHEQLEHFLLACGEAPLAGELMAAGAQAVGRGVGGGCGGLVLLQVALGGKRAHLGGVVLGLVQLGEDEAVAKGAVVEQNEGHDHERPGGNRGDERLDGTLDQEQARRASCGKGQGVGEPARRVHGQCRVGAVPGHICHGHEQEEHHEQGMGGAHERKEHGMGPGACEERLEHKHGDHEDENEAPGAAKVDAAACDADPPDEDKGERYLGAVVYEHGKHVGVGRGLEDGRADDADGEAERHHAHHCARQGPHGAGVVVLLGLACGRQVARRAVHAGKRGEGQAHEHGGRHGAGQKVDDRFAGRTQRHRAKEQGNRKGEVELGIHLDPATVGPGNAHPSQGRADCGGHGGCDGQLDRQGHAAQCHKSCRHEVAREHLAVPGQIEALARLACAPGADAYRHKRHAHGRVQHGRDGDATALKEAVGGAVNPHVHERQAQKGRAKVF